MTQCVAPKCRSAPPLLASGASNEKDAGKLAASAHAHHSCNRHDRSSVMGELTGSDIEELSKKLSDALNINTLQSYTHASTGDRLFKEFVGQGKALRFTIIYLLNVLEEN